MIYFKHIENHFYFYIFAASYTLFYVVGILCYATNHFIIKWREKIWENAPESQVIEQVKIILRKHNECADLDTVDSVISESINMTKTSLAYRIECYHQGIKDRVKQLESV